MTSHARETLNKGNRNLILIVDDNRTLRTFLGDMLAEYGYLTVVARDGLEAIDQFHKTIFPLVITNIEMPRMNGLQLLRYLKENFPSTGVIVMSGNGHDYGQDKILQAGACAYLDKPFSVQEILTEIKNRPGCEPICIL